MLHYAPPLPLLFVVFVVGVCGVAVAVAALAFRLLAAVRGGCREGVAVVVVVVFLAAH
jgi:hypothetical protein